MRSTSTYLYFAVAAALLFVGVPVFAAEIANVTVTDVTEGQATVSWNTDVNTDATVHYGLDSAYGLVRDPTLNSKDHALTITGLDPSTTYHFQVESRDDQGNTSATAGFVFVTPGPISKKINREIQKVTDPKELAAIAEQLKHQVADVLRPPAIVGSPKVIPDTNGATITWGTDRESNSLVSLAKEGEYQASSKDPYAISQGDPKEAVTKHSVTVIGLDASTVYHFSASSQDATGLTGQTEDDTFTTKSILPLQSKISITRIQESSATVNWSTGNVLSKGLIDYTDLRTHKTKSAGDPTFTTAHSIQLAGLTLGTRYSAVIRSTNQGGDEIVSKPLTFVTVRDVIPPAISKVDNESTLFPSDDIKIQTIISWATDEPAYCQVSYTQGLVHNDQNKGETLPAEVNPLTQHTQVVVGFAPAMVYKFWLNCHDIAGNQTQSDDYVLITPTKEKSIIDIILQNFQGTFGWVNNIGK